MIRAKKFDPQTPVIQSFIVNNKTEERAIKNAHPTFAPRHPYWRIRKPVLLLKLARFSVHGYEFLPKKSRYGKNIWVAVGNRSVFDCSSSRIGHPNISSSGEICLGSYHYIMSMHCLFDNFDSENIRRKSLIISNILSDIYTNPNVNDSFNTVYRSDRTQCKCPLCEKDHFVYNNPHDSVLFSRYSSSSFMNTVSLGLNELFCSGAFNKLYEKFSATTCLRLRELANNVGQNSAGEYLDRIKTIYIQSAGHGRRFGLGSVISSAIKLYLKNRIICSRCIAKSFLKTVSANAGTGSQILFPDNSSMNRFLSVIFSFPNGATDDQITNHGMRLRSSSTLYKFLTSTEQLKIKMAAKTKQSSELALLLSFYLRLNKSLKEARKKPLDIIKPLIQEIDSGSSSLLYYFWNSVYSN